MEVTLDPIRPSPEQIVAFLRRRTRENVQPSSMEEKKKALRVVLASKTSWPVIAIAIRDEVEIEMKARKQATENLRRYHEGLEEISDDGTISPGGVDAE